MKEKDYREPDLQPSELGELKELVYKFIEKYKEYEHEMDLLKENQKELVDEYKDKLDMKTLKAAMRTVKIKKQVPGKHVYEVFCEILEEKETL